MNEGLIENHTPEPSSPKNKPDFKFELTDSFGGDLLKRAEKQKHFQELLKRKEELVAAFQEALEKELPLGDDDFMEMEIATEKAAKAALEIGNKEEHDRLIEEHKAMMRWRFG